MVQLQTIDKYDLPLPICPRLKSNDIRAGWKATMDKWKSGLAHTAPSKNNIQFKNIETKALSLAIGGHSDPKQNIPGDPMVAVGVRALQFNRYVAYLNAMFTASYLIRNRILESKTAVGLSKANKAAIGRVIRKMEDNFPYKMKNKTYRGPAARDDYKLVRTPIRYKSSYSLKRVLFNLLRYINRKIDRPTRFTHGGEQKIVMRCLKRVNDEMTQLDAWDARNRKSDQEEDLMLKTYLNAVSLFTYGNFVGGKDALNLLQDKLLEYLLENEKRGLSGKDRTQSTGDIHE
jgi:hypothetical protein